MSVFEVNTQNHLEKRMFFDEPVDVARYDQQKYPFIEKLIDKQLGFFWRPEEVDVYRDAKDFKDLTDWERHIFTSNLKRQILLDSVQGRSPNIAFLPIVSLPELETWIETWSFSETVHSRSYTHIIRAVYSNPSKIFDEMLDIPEIIECATDISKHYDELINLNTLLSYEGSDFVNQMAHKKAVWRAMMSVNILEGVRFYVSFACSWAFAEQKKKMEGNAKIIKLICRDENLHLAGTQFILKNLPKDDKDFVKIQEETREECITMFLDAYQQEKDWATFLFKDGSMVGLNEQMLHDYVEWITHKRMLAVGLPSPFKGGSNPLPWTEKWISGADVQVAPQQTQISSYVIGGVKNDISDDTFKGFNL